MYENVVREHEYCAALFAALGNERRLLIMCHLLRGEYSVGRIADLVKLSQSALSQHLAKLRALGLVRTRRDGQTIYYTSNCSKSDKVLHCLEQMLDRQLEPAA